MPDLFICVLATWRVTHMLVHEHGPFGAFDKLRQKKMLSEILSCFYCASVWVGVVVALAATTPTVHFVLNALVISAGACIVTETKELIEGLALLYNKD